jgi:hypothetical protein
MENENPTQCEYPLLRVFWSMNEENTDCQEREDKRLHIAQLDVGYLGM